MLEVPPGAALLRRVEPNLGAATRVEELLTRVRAPPEALTQVSVSRLVNPGRAYYDLVHPLPEGLAAQQKRLAGSGAHDLLEELLAKGVEYTELWMHGEDAPGEPRLDRITARLDACERDERGRVLPTEIKNVGKARDRPFDEHLEQLGMYCALLGVDEGRLLSVQRDDETGRSRLLVPWKVHYRDLGEVRKAMVSRRDALTEAVARRDPSGLPACPWAAAGCKYRVAGVCDCPSRRPLDPAIARVAEWSEDPGYLALLRQRAQERERPGPTPAEERPPLTLGDYLTPRKVYFRSRAALDALSPAPEPTELVPAPEEKRAEERVARANTRGLERQIFSAVLSANPGRAKREERDVGGVHRSLPAIDGRPFLVKVRMVRRALAPTARDLSGDFGVPDDLRQLALRATLLGASGGRIYVWNWRLPEDALKLQVFDVEFQPERLAEVQAYLERLPGEVERALATSDPRGLPLCPRWMCPRCPYVEACRPDETGPAPAQ